LLHPIAICPAAGRRRTARTLIAAAVLASAAPAAAEPEPSSDAEVSRRLAFIEARLERATPSACLWWSAWYYGYAVVTVGQAGFALATTNSALRTQTAVGAAFSGLGLVGIGVVDFPPLHAAAALRALPAGTPAERRRKLARGEGLLAAGARSEVGGRSWVGHVAGIGVTLASSLVLALVYKQVVSGVVTLVSGVGIAEAQIFTRPTAAIDDWRAYQQGAWGSTATTGGPRVTQSTQSTQMTWSVVPQPGGVGLALRAAF
jgi:hypothetical protein